MNKSRGFTLIELLAVVAIIGVLTGIVLYAISDARIKGADAAIKQNMHEIGTQSGIFFATNNSYIKPPSVAPYFGGCRVSQSTYFPSSPPILNPVMLAQDNFIFNTIAKSIKLSGRQNTFSVGSNSIYTYSQCYNSTSAWAVAILLRSGNTSTNPANPYKAWCVDSTGQSKVVSFVPLPMYLSTSIISSTGVCL
ncbi:MAG: prepilin-type N-terminal cleavage/methylation domain-containing protein [Candidatus Pacebacteria bacterium]|nr:prepilin-type N-terminal cleavage/methylation domain-containing protein [Candidatus Paceibacterota bacterium]